MNTLREIRRRIKSVENIEKITQAMELVAASRLRKAQGKMEAARPYAVELQEIFNRLLSTLSDLKHPLTTARDVKKTGLVIIAGDRGLCGAYNQSVFNAADKFLKKYDAHDVELIPVGRKPLDYFQMKKWKIALQLQEWGGKITYPQIKEFTQSLINAYLNEQLDEIWLVYTHFINMTTKEIRLKKLLPIDTSSPAPVKGDYIMEPDPATLFDEILPYYCTMHVQAALNDSYTAELAARVSSMRAATKNAKKKIEELTLTRNKVRQSGITKELIEITSGAESLR